MGDPATAANLVYDETFSTGGGFRWYTNDGATLLFRIGATTGTNRIEFHNPLATANDSFNIGNAIPVRWANAAGSSTVVALSVENAANDIVLGGGTANAVVPRTTATPLGSSTNQWRLFTNVVATASLPAAGASNDGLVIIEDAAVGDRNIILYAGGQRFRVDGGAAF